MLFALIALRQLTNCTRVMEFWSLTLLLFFNSDPQIMRILHAIYERLPCEIPVALNPLRIHLHPTRKRFLVELSATE